MKKRMLFFAFLAVWIAGCATDQSEHVDIGEVRLDGGGVAIERLDAEMMRLDSKPAMMAFLQAHPALKAGFLQPEPGMPDSALAGRMQRTLTNPAYRKFYSEVQQVYGEMADVKSALDSAFRHVKYHYPDFKAPRVQTVVSGLGYLSREAAALSVSDTLVVISLDFYAGKKASFLPNVPNFLLKKYTKPALVPSVMNVLAQKYIVQNPDDKSLLNEMIGEAKKMEFVRQTMPHLPDSLILFYSPQQLADTEAHKDAVWAHFIKEKLLYETNHFQKVKYIGERPYTAEIGRDCPGAIGRWLGWQIVKKYLAEHPEITLPQLLANPNAQAIFMESKYKGQ